jgi:hypothetical protein
MAFSGQGELATFSTNHQAIVWTLASLESRPVRRFEGRWTYSAGFSADGQSVSFQHHLGGRTRIAHIDAVAIGTDRSTWVLGSSTSTADLVAALEDLTNLRHDPRTGRTSPLPIHVIPRDWLAQ